MRSQLLYSELDETGFSIERQFQVLKHFKQVDREYASFLKDNTEYSVDEITERLDAKGSDFYEGFAINPEHLWKKLKDKISEDRIVAFWIDENCELEIEYSKSEYPNGIGEDHLLHIDQLPQGILDRVDVNNWESLRKLVYRDKPKPTWKLQVILRKINYSPEVISIFPGIYAPQLPNEELQSVEEYERSLEFWKTHVVIKP